MTSRSKIVSSASGRRLTGLQSEFVSQYLGPCRFNARRAAEAAGYLASNQHSFESIGSENLSKPIIRAAIDEHFRLSRMSAQECLTELSKLARGDGKDQIKALALLSQHHGLLNGRGSIDVNKLDADISSEIDTIEDKMKALAELMGVSVEEIDETLPEQIPKQREEPQVQIIIPPSRRLQPAAIERMMADVIDVEPALPEVFCRHGNPVGKCFTFELGREYCTSWRAD